MARSLTKSVLSNSHFLSFVVNLAVIKHKNTIFEPISEREIVIYANSRKHQPFENHYHRCYCSTIEPEKLCWAGSNVVNLLKRFEIALNDHRIDEAWDAYSDFKNLYGNIPNDSLITRLITKLLYSSEPKWLEKASSLVLLLVREKPNLLRIDLLTKLLLSLARAQMPVHASMILRLMLEKENLGLPREDILGLVLLHMVKMEIGTILASNILVEICDRFQRLSSSKNPTGVKLVKPDTMIFNLVLNACLRFKSSFKGQQIIELMAQVGVIADAHTIVIISRIYEMSGQRDELKKFKGYVDRVPVPLVQHYCPFYDSLLSLHFRFDDVDSASELILDMNKCKRSLSLPSLDVRSGLEKPYFIPIGSRNLRIGLKLSILPHLLQKDSVLKVESEDDYLVMYKGGKLFPHSKALAKLIIQYKRQRRISELSKVLICMEKASGSSETGSLYINVIDACIQLGWLETAHDILDDLEQEGILLSSQLYSSLLTAYYKEKMFREAEALLKQVRKTGFEVSNGNIVSESTNLKDGSSDLATFLAQEMTELGKEEPPMVYELNSSIYFFTKAKMIDDALKTYRRMPELNIRPTVSTFVYLIHGYSSLEMYREITILWGDIKRNFENGNPVVDRDLYELLLLKFLRGGYFERVMEVIGCLKKHGMFSDKWLYKTVFLKFHRDLYRNLKFSSAKTEAQSKRLEHVQDFRKWVGID